MAHPSARKGARAELELAHELSDRLGIRVERKLGAGRAEDTGDLYGLEDWTAEVKNYRSVTEAINAGLADLAREQANAGTPFGVCFVRRPGGRWIAVMDLDQFAAVYREIAAPMPPKGPWTIEDQEELSL